jgi:hypothetical protein
MPTSNPPRAISPAINTNVIGSILRSLLFLVGSVGLSCPYFQDPVASDPDQYDQQAGDHCAPSVPVLEEEDVSPQVEEDRETKAEAGQRTAELYAIAGDVDAVPEAYFALLDDLTRQ